MTKLSIKLLLFLTRIIPHTGQKDDVILCYHDVCGDGWEFSVSKAQFKSHIQTLNQHFKIVSLDEILTPKSTSGLPRLAITFDDGYKGVFKNAYPVLTSNGATATVFIMGSGSVNPKGNLKSDFLNPKEIQELNSNGWGIGFHTLNHKDLSKISKNELYEEIVAGKHTLATKLKLKLDYFAYPSGVYSKEALSSVKNAEFKSAFTVSGDKISNTRSKYTISRITVSKFLNANDLTSLLTPTGITINRLFTALWRLKDNFSEALIVK